MAIYHPADIAKLLQVKEPTIRKYSLLLEGVGYTFKRNASGQRWYEDKDVIALQKLIAFKDNGDMKLKEAAEAVFHWSKGESVTGGLPATQSATDRISSDITNATTSDIELFTKLLEAQERRYMEALQAMQQQQAERDKLLLNQINELKQEIQHQRQLDEPTSDPEKLKSVESLSQQSSKKKKGFFANLFNKP